jgi:hypothetical protein
MYSMYIAPVIVHFEDRILTVISPNRLDLLDPLPGQHFAADFNLDHSSSSFLPPLKTVRTKPVTKLPYRGRRFWDGLLGAPLVMLAWRGSSGACRSLRQWLVEGSRRHLAVAQELCTVINLVSSNRRNRPNLTTV